jgi:hypothetical protein
MAKLRHEDSELAVSRSFGRLVLESEIAAMVERADADMAGGRYVVVASPDDSEALHEAAMARLRTRIANDPTER